MNDHPAVTAGPRTAEAIVNDMVAFFGNLNEGDQFTLREFGRAIEDAAFAQGVAAARAAVEGLPVHVIGGYEWDCDNCHYHFTGHPCHITGVVADKDGEVDATEQPTSHRDLVNRDNLRAALDSTDGP